MINSNGLPAIGDRKGTDHDETKLPKWAQKRLEDLRFEVDGLQGLKKLHGLLADKDRDWYTVPGPAPDAGKESITLHVFYPNHAHPVCTLGVDDILYVGRAKK
jgi:hypothetical protein